MNYGKYGYCAIRAVILMKSNNLNANMAWLTAAEEIFGKGSSGSKKSCPKNAFLSLMGQNNKRSKNGIYAAEALDILNKLGKDNVGGMSPSKFWRDKMGKK